MVFNVFLFFRFASNNPVILVPLLLLLALLYIFNQKKLIGKERKYEIISNLKGHSANPEEDEIADAKLNPVNVPDNLRDITDLAEIWGIENPDRRRIYIMNCSREEKEEFANRLKGRETEIDKWIGSFEDKVMSDEAVRFMYMVVALEEIHK